MEPKITEIGVFHASYISCIEDTGSQTFSTEEKVGMNESMDDL